MPIDIDQEIARHKRKSINTRIRLYQMPELDLTVQSRISKQEKV